MNPRFLTVEDVVAIHIDQIDAFGGQHGVRDMAMVESAVNQPRAMFGGQYLHEDLFDMAAAYMVSLVNGHSFHDGNHRIALAAAMVFLEINGITLDESLTDRLFQITKDAADQDKGKRLSRRQVADLLRDLSRNSPS